ncbi:zinc finger protein 622 [Fopius arisanus]|uniref:Zinc finger protein 622 n=1 Tax=Fopius arisanus TaxID=64838 RepID=A0A9R1SY09_9HYME|nr:PREDICTED: zinc finger protein 622 [Fopius arisanus]
MEGTRDVQSPYTCITCRVAFRDLDIQRQHYKSDWHRYNLKRKVAELPPVPVEEFQKRVIAQRGDDDALKNPDETFICRSCRKIFNTKNQYENHILSKKHSKNVQKISEASTGEDSTTSSFVMVNRQSKKDSSRETSDEMDIELDVESLDSDEWLEDVENPLRNNNCLFCYHHSKSVVKNLKHMTEAHSFFIPDPEYCVDLKGLLEYLGQKVFAGFMCLWCDDKGKVFHSADAARAHMVDKGHCKMLHEGEALVEYSDFYDYSSSYPDAEEHEADAEVEIPELDDGDYQLVLPSGNIIGHRSLMRYYKQSFDPNRAVAIPKNEKLRRVLCHYRALGWTETQKEAVVRKARDISYMQRVQAKYSTKMQFKANKFQRYFRQQVNF